MHATSQHVLQHHLPPHLHQIPHDQPIPIHFPNTNSPGLHHHQQSINGQQQLQQQQQQHQQHQQPPQHSTHHQPTHHHPPAHHPPSQRSNPSAAPKEPTRVVGIPAAVISGDRFVYGDAQSTSERSYTPIKSVGDGSFGTVWLVDWHTKLPPNTPLSAMQCGDGAKPDWAGKRLVALKQMKKRWEGGWDECKKLKELESLRAIPFHPNIIPLYDSFLLPTTKELYFVFEPMEGNLYQLIKSRRGRPLAGGLVSCIFRQVVSGLHHIHANGYFHRDMKPENLLVTTTGLFDYRNVSPVAQPNAPPERDVVVIVKLADFGLARETKSKPPYTEYVSTRWYRAPEVLLRSRDYSNPVDMWALGTIMAELVNLKPLFPGSTEVDQVARICEILGDPSDQYGVDARGVYNGGGKWVRGIKMARSVGFQFPKLKPVPIQQLFDRAVPLSIIQCISDLLKYDPEVRLTSKQCLEHPYIMETMAGNIPPGPQVPFTVNTNHVKAMPSMNAISPRTCPPSHSQSPASGKPPFNGNGQSHRKPYFPQGGESSLLGSPDACEPMQIQTDSLLPPNAPADAMDISPISPQIGNQQQQFVEPLPMEVIVTSPGAESSKRAASQNQMSASITAPPIQPSASGSKYNLFKPGRLGFGRMFGHGDKAQPQGLPPVDELNVASSSSSPSLKRTQTGSTDSHPPSEISSIGEPIYAEPPAPMDAKARKKEAEKVALEAEKARRAMAEKRSREQARAVLQKRNMLAKQRHGSDLDWDGSNATSMLGVHKPKPKSRTGLGAQTSLSSATINAAGGRFRSPVDNGNGLESDITREAEHRTKARRRDLDDDHSMSSSDIPNGRASVMSFATVESDPISSRIRHRPSLFGVSRMQSASSLRTSFGDEYSLSGHSISSPSYDPQAGSDYDSRASMSSYDPTRSSISELQTPLPMQSLSISSPQQHAQMLSRQPFIHLPPVHTMSHQPFRAPTPGSPYDYGSYNNFQGPPSPAIAPHSAINPIFKVAPLPQAGDASDNSPHSSLPPFSELASIAEPLQSSELS